MLVALVSTPSSDMAVRLRVKEARRVLLGRAAGYFDLAALFRGRLLRHILEVEIVTIVVLITFFR